MNDFREHDSKMFGMHGKYGSLNVVPRLDNDLGFADGVQGLGCFRVPNATALWGLLKGSVLSWKCVCLS